MQFRGDQLALEKLTKANLRFVVSVAKQYQNQGLTLPDLINEGNLGLIKAAQRFDETRGFKFISYAVWWIRQSILQALAEQSRIVRLPLNKIGSINKINKTYAFLEQSHERPPSAEEIANELDMTINDVKESMKNSGRHVSMDAPLVEGAVLAGAVSAGGGTLEEVKSAAERKTDTEEILHSSEGNIQSVKIRHKIGLHARPAVRFTEMAKGFKAEIGIKLENQSKWVLITSAWGFSVFVGAYISSSYSGAHLNPAVTIGLAVAGKFSWALVPHYILCLLYTSQSPRDS